MPEPATYGAAQMDVIPDGTTHNRYILKFQKLQIEWRFPVDVPPMPVAINWGKLGTDKDLIVMTDITFRRGRWSITVLKGYEYDGASIPRFIRWAPGYQRVGRHLFAATIHDWILDHPEEDLPRVIADAIFITALLDTGIERRQSKLMYYAVRIWSTYRAWMAGEESPVIVQAVEQAAEKPVTKAVAVSEAAEVAKSETSVPPGGDQQTQRREEAKP